MANTINPGDLSDAISSELKLYAKDIQERCAKAGEASIKELVKRTKATAPVGKRKYDHFKDSISYKKFSERIGSTRYVWYVKAPNYRLTHLLVNGHQTRNGGRTRANPFLRNALDEILPQYEQSIKEAIQK